MNLALHDIRRELLACSRIPDNVPAIGQAVWEHYIL